MTRLHRRPLYRLFTVTHEILKRVRPAGIAGLLTQRYQDHAALTPLKLRRELVVGPFGGKRSGSEGQGVISIHGEDQRFRKLAVVVPVEAQH